MAVGSTSNRSSSIPAVALVAVALATLPVSHAFHSRIPIAPPSATSSIPVTRRLSILSSSVEDVVSIDNMIVDETGNPRKVGLALLLDDGTRKSHSVAQNSAFVTGFFKGIATREAYSELLTGLYFVYRTMEDAFDACDDERVRTMDDSRLRRASALAEDMEYFHGANWENTVKASPAAAKYVARVTKVAKEEPYLLVAHQYTRYLGDLFGGQMMGGMATRSLGLEDGKGTDFYQFESVDSVTDFITEWYKMLNGLDLTKQQKEAIIDEANLVFDLNIEIFTELEGNPFQSMWTLAIDALRSKLGLGAEA